MKKVLYVAPFVVLRYKGGIMKIAEYLGNESAKELFSKSNFELEFFNSHFLVQSKNSEGKLYIENFRQALSFYRRLKERLENKNFDLLHINSSHGLPLLKDLIIISILRLKTSKPIIFQIHFCGIRETFLFSRFFLKFHFYLLSKLDILLLLSNSFKEELIFNGYPKHKLSVIHNFHHYSKVNINNKSIIGPRLSLLFIGSISERKGIFDLFEALQGINFDYELIIAGSFESNKIEKKCLKIVRSNNLNVNFVGYLNSIDKVKILTDADILILPSYSEGFPLVIPEAMAFGCAIISTRVGGIPEIVKENVNGFLIEPGQVNKLKSHLEYLSNHKEILASFKKCSVTISNKFNLSTFIEELTTIYTNTEADHNKSSQ